MPVVRPTMSDLIARVRKMINDPAGVDQQFQDIDLQISLDEHRNDVRYLPLDIAPSIINTASTNHIPETIFADYYAPLSWWESDAVLQGQDANGNAWVVLTPVASDYVTGHFQFELDVFNTGTVPGQRPPVWITGKVYDLFGSSADLLEYWANSLARCVYDITVDGQSLRRSQIISAMKDDASRYRMRAQPRVAQMVRRDVQPALSSRGVRLLDSDDVFRGM